MRPKADNEDRELQMPKGYKQKIWNEMLGNWKKGKTAFDHNVKTAEHHSTLQNHQSYDAKK